MPAKTSGLPLAWRKHRSWDRTLTLPQPSASMTMNWMSSMTSFIWAQLSQTPSHLTQSSTGASARQLPPWPDWQRKHGTTASWLCTQRSRSTEPASWVLSYMAVSPGHCVPDRSKSSMLFTCAASDAFWTSPGRTRSQTTLSWKELDAPACSRCWNRETYALARPRRAHGRRTDPQRPPLWRTRAGKMSHSAGKMSHRQTTAAIQRCVQEGPKALNIDQNNSEATALKRSAWRQTVQKGLSNFEETLAQQHRKKKMRRKAAAHTDRPVSDFVCVLCHRDCHSSIGLVSHTLRCTRINT